MGMLAGMPVHIKSFLNVVERWGSKWQTLTLKASGATSEKFQLRFLLVMNCRNSHQKICSQPLVYLLPWQHSVTLCTLQKWFANVLSLFPSLRHPFLSLALLLFCIPPLSLSVHIFGPRCSSSPGGSHTVIQWLIIKRLIHEIKLCMLKKKVHMLYLPACAFECTTSSFSTHVLAKSFVPLCKLSSWCLLLRWPCFFATLFQTFSLF